MWTDVNTSFLQFIHLQTVSLLVDRMDTRETIKWITTNRCCFFSCSVSRLSYSSIGASTAYHFGTLTRICAIIDLPINFYHLTANSRCDSPLKNVCGSLRLQFIAFLHFNRPTSKRNSTSQSDWTRPTVFIRHTVNCHRFGLYSMNGSQVFRLHMIHTWHGEYIFAYISFSFNLGVFCFLNCHFRIVPSEHMCATHSHIHGNRVNSQLIKCMRSLDLFCFTLDDDFHVHFSRAMEWFVEERNLPTRNYCERNENLKHPLLLTNSRFMQVRKLNKIKMMNGSFTFFCGWIRWRREMISHRSNLVFIWISIESNENVENAWVLVFGLLTWKTK